MKRKSRSYAILLLLASISLASCFYNNDDGGNGVTVLTARIPGCAYDPFNYKINL